MCLVKEGCRSVDSRQKANVRGLSDLALMARLEKPLDVCFEGWPPEVVKEGTVRGVEALVAEFVVSITDESILQGGVSIELMASVMLSLPKMASHNKEVAGSADETH